MFDSEILIFLGVVNTSLLHLAKAMQKHGINRHHQWQEDGIDKRISVIYLVGLFLNQTPLIWGTLAGKYGSTELFTSMFPLGLIILVLYANLILKEPITANEILGIFIVIVGIGFISYENLYRIKSDYLIDTSITFTLIMIILAFSIILILFGFKTKKNALITLIFGFCAGGLGSLDPVLKSSGIQINNTGNIFPNNVIGWVFYLLSFLFGFLSVFLTQIGFRKGARASVLVPFSSIGYVVLPLLLQQLTIPGFSLGLLSHSGIILTLCGTILLGQAYEKIDHKSISSDISYYHEKNQISTSSRIFPLFYIFQQNKI